MGDVEGNALSVAICVATAVAVSVSSKCVCVSLGYVLSFLTGWTCKWEATSLSLGRDPRVIGTRMGASGWAGESWAREAGGGSQTPSIAKLIYKISKRCLSFSLLLNFIKAIQMGISLVIAVNIGISTFRRKHIGDTSCSISLQTLWHRSFSLSRFYDSHNNLCPE